MHKLPRLTLIYSLLRRNIVGPLQILAERRSQDKQTRSAKNLLKNQRKISRKTSAALNVTCLRTSANRAAVAMIARDFDPHRDKKQSPRSSVKDRDLSLDQG